jgi:ubiquinone/menaquinone biosynthesis C-methylase UbiE
MKEQSIASIFNDLSGWAIILILVLILLIVVATFNTITNRNKSSNQEGFIQQDVFTLKEGPEIYDDFYAGLYDQLVFNQAKDSYEIGEIINATKPTSESIVLDIGSGTGHHVALLEAQGVKTTGVDSSAAMVKKAEENYPQYKFVEGNVMDSSLFMPGSYTHILCLYFSIYYFKDKMAFFNNTMRWLMPGGFLVVHVVERDMFDPILPPANPLFLVSPQRYAKERITQSKVMFNNMEYVANFNLDPDKNIATFTEKFKEKDSDKTRKNKHIFYMEPHKAIIVMAQEAGFILQGKIDLLKVGYEYQYLYIFAKPQ